jgi:hypothetical protein
MGRVNAQRLMRLASARGCNSVNGISFSRFPDTKLPGAMSHLDALALQGWLL